MDNTIQAITRTVAMTRNPNLWLNYDFAFAMMGKPALQSGTKIQVPVRYAQFPTEYFIGAESANVNRQEWQTAAYHLWVTGRVNMMYTLDDKIANNGGQSAIVDYVKSLMTNGEESLAAQFVRDFLGTGTSLTRRQINSFQHIANNAADTLGTGTIFGEIDKNVVTDPVSGKKVYAGVVFDLAGAGHGPTRGNLIRMVARAKNGPRKPDLCVGHTLVVAEIVAGASSGTAAVQRFVNTNELGIGFEVYTVDGIKLYGQEDMPLYTGTAPYNVGTVAINAVYGINTQSTKVVVHADTNFITRPWVKLPLSEAYYSSRLAALNAVCDDPRTNVVMRNFDWNGTSD